MGSEILALQGYEVYEVTYLQPTIRIDSWIPSSLEPPHARGTSQDLWQRLFQPHASGSTARLLRIQLILDRLPLPTKLNSVYNDFVIEFGCTQLCESHGMVPETEKLGRRCVVPFCFSCFQDWKFPHLVYCP